MKDKEESEDLEDGKIINESQDENEEKIREKDIINID